MERVLKILVFLLGLFAGMDAFYIKIGTLEVTVFTELLMITVIVKLITNPVIYPKGKEPLSIYFCITIVSNIISFVNVPQVWFVDNIISLVSNIVGIIGFWFLFNSDDIYIHAKSFLMGFKINCIIQMLWAIMQFVMCEFFHLSLNSLCGLKKAREGLTLAEQVSGFGWERASLCLTMTFAIVLYNNIWIKLTAIFIAVICQSRSGLILVFLVIVMSSDWKRLKQLSSNGVIKMIFAIMILVFLVIVNFDYIFPLVTESYMRFLDLDKDASAAGHMSYYSRFPTIIKQCSLSQIIFGFGGASAGFPYTKYYGRFAEIGGSWALESSWLTVFWASGITGFAVFSYWYLGKMKYFHQNGKRVFSLLFAILIGGIGYALFATWSEIAIIFIMKMYEDEKFLVNARIGK